MKKIPIFSVAVILVAMLLGCGGRTDNGKPASEKQFDSIFEHVVTSPDIDKTRAFVADAAKNNKISLPQQQYFNAILVYREMNHFDSVLKMCQPLVEDPKVAADKLLLYRVYALMTDAAKSYNSFADMVEYASHTVELARQLGKTDKEQEMVGTMGYGMVLLGRNDEGLRMIDGALAKLAPLDEWNCRNSYIILSKIKIGALDELKQYSDILAVCRNVLTLLDNMTTNPQSIKHLPHNWYADKQAFVEAMNLYRSQMYAYMTYAYAKLGDRKQALLCLEAFDKSGSKYITDSYHILVAALGELQMFDRMLKIYDFIDEIQCGDTITQTYSDELELKAKAAASHGDFSTARLYLRRTIALNDTLYKLRDQEQMARMLSMYKVHDEQLKANAASSTAKIMLIIVVALFCITVVTLSFMILVYRQNRKMVVKNKVLVSMIHSTYSYKEKYKELLKKSELMKSKLDDCVAKDSVATIETDNSPIENTSDVSQDASLFARMDMMIREKEMYLANDFQRQTIVDEMGIDRNKIGKLIHDFSGFSNLSAYINSFRLEYAYRLLLRGDTGLTIEDVARQSGFTTLRTFQRLFKEMYGMTPAEFREAK